MTAPLRWLDMGDGRWLSTGGYRVQLKAPLTDEWTLTLPDGRKHTGPAQECRQIAAQHAQEAMQ